MSAFDVIVRGATVVAAGGSERLDVAVLDGRIAAVAPELEGPAGEEVDARDLHVLPAAIDPHLHFSRPDAGRARRPDARPRPDRPCRGARRRATGRTPMTPDPVEDGRP